MTKDEALRLAAEAIMDELEAVTAEEFEDAAGKLDDALRAIRKALVDAVDTSEECVDETVIRGHEPVGYVQYFGPRLCFRTKPKKGWVPVFFYAAPVEPVKQKPVAVVQTINGVTIGYLEKMLPVGTKLYTTPQPRLDVDLTDAITLLEEGLEGISSSWNKRARAVIAAYKEKNSGNQ